MNLKIKCDTPKEQVLVLRKFKKLVPECRWDGGGEIPTEWLPFVDSNSDSIWLYLEDQIILCDKLVHNNYTTFPTFTASDFLRDNWKLEEKSELLTKLKVIQDQLNELEKLIKKESL